MRWGVSLAIQKNMTEKNSPLIKPRLFYNKNQNKLVVNTPLNINTEKGLSKRKKPGRSLKII